MAVQYAVAMGLNVAAVDIDDDKLAFAQHLGANVTINARKEDPAQACHTRFGGAHGALVTAVSPQAFEQADRRAAARRHHGAQRPAAR
nr:alcohol dehydrogenase [Candidatus Pantoea persica]